MQDLIYFFFTFQRRELPFLYFLMTCELLNSMHYFRGNLYDLRNKEFNVFLYGDTISIGLKKFRLNFFLFKMQAKIILS